jgi:hypothetical protein
MDQDGCKEQQRGDHAEHPVGNRIELGEVGRVVAFSQRPADENETEQPGVMQLDRDPSNSTYVE